MPTNQWWSVFDVQVSTSPMPNSYIIECRRCGERFQTYRLENLPSRCPECSAKEDTDAD